MRKSRVYWAKHEVSLEELLEKVSSDNYTVGTCAGLPRTSWRSKSLLLVDASVMSAVPAIELKIPTPISSHTWLVYEWAIELTPPTNTTETMSGMPTSDASHFNASPGNRVLWVSHVPTAM